MHMIRRRLTSIIFMGLIMVPLLAQAGATTPLDANGAGGFLGPCDATDALKLVRAANAADEKLVLLLLDGRIQSCKAIIAQFYSHLPTAPSAILPSVNPKGLPLFTMAPPPAPPDCHVDADDTPSRHRVLEKYNMLAFCAQWVARNVPVAAPAPASTSSPSPPSFAPSGIGGRAKQNIYVLALATDAPTSAQISLQMTEQLTLHLRKKPPSDAYTNTPVSYRVLAAPTWTVSQFQAQCANDPTTAGAIIVLPPATDSASWNYLLVSQWTKVRLQAMVAECKPTNRSFVNNVAYLTWITNTESGTGERLSFSLATALAIYSGILAAHPQHTNTYTIKTPNPKEYKKLPIGSTYESSYTTGTNTGTGFVAGVAVAALTPLASTNIGLGLGVDAQTAQGIGSAIPKLESDILSKCSTDDSEASISDLTQCRWFSHFGFSGSGYSFAAP